MCQSVNGCVSEHVPSVTRRLVQGATLPSPWDSWDRLQQNLRYPEFRKERKADECDLAEKLIENSFEVNCYKSVSTKSHRV